MDGQSVNHTSQTNKNRRQAGRMLADALNCSHGKMCDLSAVGARIVKQSLFAPKKGQTWDLIIGSEDAHVLVQSEIMRVTRTGLTRYDIGLRFIEPSPETQKKLTELARAAYTESGQIGHYQQRCLGEAVSMRKL